MDLTDALITTDGAPLARGTIKLPPDQAGIFACAPHDHLVLDLKGWWAPRLIPAVAVRDPATGYMRAEQVGPSLALPLPLQLEFISFLRHPNRDPLVARADHTGGHLASAGDPVKRVHQQLSNFILRAEGGAEAASFTIEADLRALHPFASWDSVSKNHWGDQSTARLTARFSVDAATSCLGCGTWNISESPIVEHDAYPFGHEGIRLERSVVDILGTLLAGSPDRQIWSLRSGPRGFGPQDPGKLTLTRVRLERQENGLFRTRAWELGSWIDCSAFTLEQIMAQLVRGRRLELSASGGQPASLHTGTREDAHTQHFDAVAVTAEARPGGIAVTLAASTGPVPRPGPQIEFVLPREAVLVHYPLAYAKLYDPL